METIKTKQDKTQQETQGALLIFTHKLRARKEFMIPGAETVLGHV